MTNRDQSKVTNSEQVIVTNGDQGEVTKKEVGRERKCEEYLDLVKQTTTAPEAPTRVQKIKKSHPNSILIRLSVHLDSWNDLFLWFKEGDLSEASLSVDADGLTLRSLDFVLKFSLTFVGEKSY